MTTFDDASADQLRVEDTAALDAFNVYQRLTIREQCRLSEMSDRADVQDRARRVAGLRPVWRYYDDVPVRIDLPHPGGAQRQLESRLYAGDGMVDMTAPAKGSPAPGPRLNVYPRAQRGIGGWLRRRLEGVTR